MLNKKIGPIKHCRHCKCLLKRQRYPSGDLVGFHIFSKKKFCSYFCFNEHRKKYNPKRKHCKVKNCKFCGKRIRRKKFGNRFEDNNIFLKRRFCSIRCSASKKVVKKGTYLLRARKYKKKYCTACGSITKLQAHHIDQDFTSYTKKNIQTLCKYCHDFWHSTQKRLGRKIAGRMPKMIKFKIRRTDV